MAWRPRWSRVLEHPRREPSPARHGAEQPVPVGDFTAHPGKGVTVPRAQAAPGRRAGGNRRSRPAARPGARARPWSSCRRRVPCSPYLAIADPPAADLARGRRASRRRGIRLVMLTGDHRQRRRHRRAAGWDEYRRYPAGGQGTCGVAELRVVGGRHGGRRHQRCTGTAVDLSWIRGSRGGSGCRNRSSRSHSVRNDLVRVDAAIDLSAATLSKNPRHLFFASSYLQCPWGSPALAAWSGRRWRGRWS